MARGSSVCQAASRSRTRYAPCYNRPRSRARRSGGIGRRAGLKIRWCESTVSVRARPPVLENYLQECPDEGRPNLSIQGGISCGLDASFRDVYNPVTYVVLRSMEFARHVRVTVGVLKKRLSRSKYYQRKRARYRGRRLVAVLILACLFFGVGTLAAAYFEGGLGSSAGTARTDGSPRVVPAAFDRLLALGDTSTVSADSTREPAHRKTKHLAASGSRESITE